MRLGLLVLVLAVVVVWGWTFVVVKDAVEVFGATSFLTVRFSLAALCLGVFCRGRFSKRTLVAGLWPGMLLGSAFLSQTLGLTRVTATNAGLITGLLVVFAPLAGRIFFGVRIHPVLWAAVALSVVGLTMLAGGAPSGFSGADLLVVLGAAGFGTHIAVLERYAAEHDPIVLAFGQMVGAAMLLGVAWLGRLGIGLAQHEAIALTWPTGQVWFALAVTGCLASAGAYFVQTYVQQRLSAVETALLMATEPIFAAIFGHLLHADRLLPVQLFGATLLVVAVFSAEVYPLVRGRSNG